MARNSQEGDHTIAIITLTLVWAFGVLCGVAFTLLIQAGIIVK